MIVFISAILFSLSANLDNFVVGFAYGVKKIEISFYINLLIAILTSVGTTISLVLGNLLYYILPKFIVDLLGSLIIILIGLYFLIQSLIKHKKKKTAKEVALKDVKAMLVYAEKTDIDKSGDIDIKEGLLIGLGLSINNFGVGIAFSLTGVNIFITSFFSFIFSLFTLSIGVKLGKKLLGKNIGDLSPYISSILLIILGIIEFCF